MSNTLTYSTAGEAKLLNGVVLTENLTLKLYTACATAGGVPLPSSVVGDFTEATFTGYSAKTLTGTQTGTTWSAASGTPAVTQYNAATPQSWTLTAGTQTILGYFYVGVTSGTFYGAQSFAAAIALSTGQPSFTLIPAITMGTVPAPTS
jgi:hypothetical protein